MIILRVVLLTYLFPSFYSISRRFSTTRKSQTLPLQIWRRGLNHSPWLIRLLKPKIQLIVADSSVLGSRDELLFGRTPVPSLEANEAAPVAMAICRYTRK